MTVTDLELYRNHRVVEVSHPSSLVLLESATPVLASHQRTRDRSGIRRFVDFVTLWCVAWFAISVVTVMLVSPLMVFAPDWATNNFVLVKAVYWTPMVMLIPGWVLLMVTMPFWNNNDWCRR